MSKPIALVIALAVAAPVIALGAEPVPQHGAAQAKPEIAPEADKLLRQMTDYLASLRAFRVQSYAID
jgi:hypothetical protein